MAATVIENTGTEPFTLPSPLRGILAPRQVIYLNLTLSQVAIALGGTAAYLPPQSAMVGIKISYNSAYSGAYNTYYEGGAGGANAVAIPAAQVPYGAAGGASLTSEAGFEYNATSNTLSVPNVVASTGASVGGAAAASAALTVTSTTQGLLFPRMTEVERDAIVTPAAGLVIYNTTTNKLNLRVAAAWEVITSA